MKKFFAFILSLMLFFSVNCSAKSEKTISLYYPNYNEGLLVSIQKKVILDESSKESIIKKVLLKLNNIDEKNGVFSPFYNGLKMSFVKVYKDICYINIDKSYKSCGLGGSQTEALTIYSVVNSITSVKGVNRVIFTVDGRFEREFLGHIDMMTVFKFDKDFCKN